MIKKLTILIIILGLTLAPVGAKNTVLKTTATAENAFNIDEAPNEIVFTINEKITVKDIEIPENAKLKAKIINSQREKRWHKAGFIICKLIEYLDEENTVNISQKEIYLTGRRYEKTNGKDAAFTTTEFVAASAASVFVPGVDILYYFTKGAIQRKNNKNWAKAGISNAYENSICWLWLKGKPIYLNEGDSVKLKEIKQNKAEKLDKKIDNYNEKIALKAEKKEKKLKEKEEKRILKEENKSKKIDKKEDKELIETLI